MYEVMITTGCKLLSAPTTLSGERTYLTTANHLSCHALASPWRANVSSCEEQTAHAEGILFASGQSLAFCLAHGYYGERAAFWPEYCYATHTCSPTSHNGLVCTRSWRATPVDGRGGMQDLVHNLR
jgi:hypothetical protein